MSLIYDKGKSRHSTDKNSSRLKKNENFQINQNIVIKNNNKKNIIKKSPIYSEYISASPLENNNGKKKPFLTTFHNYNYLNNNLSNGNSNTNNKRQQINKLQFNKSFEGKIGRDNISKNLGFLKDEIFMNFKDKYNDNKKLVNNSVIVNHRYKIKNKSRKNNKSVSKSLNMNNNINNKKANEEMIIKNLDERFKSLENNIIDKQYLNDIDHDEIIVTTNKKNKNPNTSRLKMRGKNNTPSYNLSNAIDEKNNIEEKYEDIFMKVILSKILLNNNYDENYLLNSSFENNRNDFTIMYTDNYEQTVIDDMLSLEIKLLIEKMLEMQKSFHKELNLILGQHSQNNKIMKLLIEKIKFIQKKILLIKNLKEKQKMQGNVYNFLEIYNHNNQHDIYKINKNEFFLWNNIMNMNKTTKEKNKEKLKEIFKKIIFERYYKINGKMNNIENKIILNLMKKYKFNLNKKENNIKSSSISNSTISTTSANKWNQRNKNINSINKHKKINSNLNNNNNNKKIHKKTSSCTQTKSSKYSCFKNNPKFK